MQHGASVTQTFTFGCCNLPESKYVHCDQKDALDFALLLKAKLPEPLLASASREIEFMDEVISTISNYYFDIATRQSDGRGAGFTPKTKMVPVPEYTYELWKSLLLNPVSSDVHFLCPDKPEEKLFAHKCILIAASPYFATLFCGNWGDVSQDGAITTNHSHAVISALLKYIYTGELEDSFVADNTLLLLELSAQWGLLSLKTLCEHSCIKLLSVKTAKDILATAHLHECKQLLAACFAFIKRNSAAVLTSSKFLALKQSHQELWAEVVREVGGTAEDDGDEGEEAEEAEEGNPYKKARA